MKVHSPLSSHLEKLPPFFKKKKTDDFYMTVETLKKMLATETENSKAMISQLNQLRTNASSFTSAHSNHHHHTNSQNNNQLNDKTIEDLKLRLSIIGDFTGFQILSSTPDKKGAILDCILTDIVNRSLGMYYFYFPMFRDYFFILFIISTNKSNPDTTCGLFLFPDLVTAAHDLGVGKQKTNKQPCISSSNCIPTIPTHIPPH
jgi:hypothetical protein